MPRRRDSSGKESPLRKLLTPTVARIEKHPDLALPDLAGELTFLFQGRPVRARKGDSIASALLVHGVKLFSRSYKYHRPRGSYDWQGMGSETLVTVDNTPNVLADRMLVQEGMDVRTQNSWPSVRFDLMAVNDFLVPLLPNGFYYKMFHRPRWAWPWFEKMLRWAAGLGRCSSPARYTNASYSRSDISASWAAA